MTTQTISKFSRTVSPLLAHPVLGRIRASEVRNISVSVRPTEPADTADPFLAGCAFHDLLLRIRDNGSLSPFEKRYLPWLSGLRKDLRAMGVSRIEPERWLCAVGSIPAGICDLRVHGGPNPDGVIEVKVRAMLPESAIENDMLQAGAYASLIGARTYSPVWAAVAYVSFRARAIRVFVYNDATQLAESASELFAAAA